MNAVLNYLTKTKGANLPDKIDFILDKDIRINVTLRASALTALARTNNPDLV